jgi:hypothetical protein
MVRSTPRHPEWQCDRLAEVRLKVGLQLCVDAVAFVGIL